MKTYAFICTRDKICSPTLKKLLEYLASVDVSIKLLISQNSIFSGYEKVFNSIKPDDDDIIILCHDDIEILTPKETFNTLLQVELNKKTGFIGVAGTTLLGTDAVWWNHKLWTKGYHRGQVFHLMDKSVEKTYYGEPGEVVVMDGLFLAARASTIKDVGLAKPDYFEGEWDFYDIHYTSKAYHLGYENKVIPLGVLHNSIGELVGRTSWHKNREAFIKKVPLPLGLSKIGHGNYS